MGFVGRGRIQVGNLGQQRIRAQDNRIVQADVLVCTSDFFDVMDVKLIRGRFFTDRRDTDVREVVVSESAVKQLQLSGGVLGRTVSIEGTGSEPHLIVGITKDADYFNVERRHAPQAYLSFGARPRVVATVVVASARGEQLMPELERVVRAVEPRALVTNQQTLIRLEREAVGPARLQMYVFSSLGVLGIIVVVGGIAGIVVHRVRTQRREWAVRWALGATDGTLVAGLMGRMAAYATAGAACGVAFAYVVSGITTGLVFGYVRPSAVDYIVGVAAATLISLAASGLAASRVWLGDHSAILRS